jgi:hypothetical protein
MAAAATESAKATIRLKQQQLREFLDKGGSRGWVEGNAQADKLAEPFFAILNFAKINDSPMTATWVMEVDWVKHEAWY